MFDERESTVSRPRTLIYFDKIAIVDSVAASGPWRDMRHHEMWSLIWYEIWSAQTHL